MEVNGTVANKLQIQNLGKAIHCIFWELLYTVAYEHPYYLLLWRSKEEVVGEGNVSIYCRWSCSSLREKREKKRKCSLSHPIDFCSSSLLLVQSGDMGTLVCHCSHDESSGESHCRPRCQPIQHLVCLPVQISGF